MKIRDIVLDLKDNKGMSRSEIANSIGVSTSMITVWSRETSDFMPRLDVARTIYNKFGYLVYPYSETALKDT